MQIIRPPQPNEIRELRAIMKLDAKQCANLLHVNTRTWHRWERGDTPMPYAYWELYAIKCEMIRTGVVKL
jgi:DNA-binding transcriptional regulator YiaG